MLAYYAKRSPGEEFQRINAPLKESGVWVSGVNMSDAEIDGLIERYELDSNVVYDVRDRGELPRVEYAEKAAYVFVRSSRLSKAGKMQTLPLLCVLTNGSLLTLSIGDSIEPETVAMSTLPITTDHTQTLLLGVIAAVVASFEEIIEHTSRSIIDTANRLKTHEITNTDFIHFVTVESNLNHSRMNLESTLAMTHRLRENKRDLLDNDSLEALDDISLHIQQLMVSIESHLNSVESIRNAYSTVANNALNERMKTLTVFTVLITLPNVFYGMLGMNVIMPFPSNQHWVFPAIVALTVAVIFIVYLIGKRLRIF